EHITCNPIMPGFTAPKLLWLHKHESRVFGSIAKVLSPKDYVVFRLTGEIGTERSDAAGTLWLDVAAREWSAPMLAATGLGVEHMPTLRASCEPAGVLLHHWALRWGMSG